MMNHVSTNLSEPMQAHPALLALVRTPSASAIISHVERSLAHLPVQLRITSIHPFGHFSVKGK